MKSNRIDQSNKNSLRDAAVRLDSAANNSNNNNSGSNTNNTPTTTAPNTSTDKQAVRQRLNGWSDRADQIISSDRFSPWRDRLERLTALDIGKSAAASCFYILFSVFPLIILVVNIFTLLAPNLVLDIQENTDVIRAIIPEQIWYFLVDFVDSAARSSGHIAAVSVAAIGLFWAAAKGVGVIIGSLHSIYNSNAKQRSGFLFDRIFGILAILVIAILLLAILLFLSFSRPILGYAAQFIALPDFLAKDLFSLTTLLVAFGALTLVFLLVYQVLSRNRSYFRYTLLCSLIAAAGWLIISSALSIFFEYRADYYSMYGNVTGIIFLMLWLFLANYILMAVAFIHTELMRKYPKPGKDFQE